MELQLIKYINTFCAERLNSIIIHADFLPREIKTKKCGSCNFSSVHRVMTTNGVFRLLMIANLVPPRFNHDILKTLIYTVGLKNCFSFMLIFMGKKNTVHFVTHASLCEARFDISPK